MHGVVRGEGPAVGRLACGGNGGEGVLPGDGAGDHLVVHGRIGAELDVAQGHAVDDGVGSHGDEHAQFTLVHRLEVHGEGDILVVGGRDLDGDSADGASRRDGILVDGQDQLAIFDLRIPGLVITGVQLHGGLSIRDFAVGPGAFQRGQGGQVDGVGVRQIVDDVQGDLFVEGGHGGLFDVEGRVIAPVALLCREIRIGHGLVSGGDSLDVDNLGRGKDEVLVFQRDRLVDGLILARVRGDKLCGGHFVIALARVIAPVNFPLYLVIHVVEVGIVVIRFRQLGGAVVDFCVRLVAQVARLVQLARSDLPVEGFRACVLRTGIRGRDGQRVFANLSRGGTFVGVVTIAQLTLRIIRFHCDLVRHRVVENGEHRSRRTIKGTESDLSVRGPRVDRDRGICEVDFGDGDGDLGALGIAATGAGDEVGMFPSGKIGGQLVFYAVDPFHRRGRRGTLQLIPCVGGHGHVIYPAARFQRHRSRRTICHGRRDFFLIRAYRVQHDALDGCFLNGDKRPLCCLEVTVIRPVTVSVLEGIALLQQAAEGQIGHLFIGNRHLTDLALFRAGVLDRRSGVHAQRIDVVTVQIEEERIVDHHRSSGHVRQQLQRAAVVFVRVNERIAEGKEILCIRAGDIDLSCGFHPTGGAGILRHGFSIRRAVIADLLADGALAVFPLVLARAHGHFVCRLGLVAQVE